MQLEAPATADVAPQPETEVKPLVSDAPGTSEAVESDEAKNARLQAEESEKAAEKEKRRQSAIQRRMDELTAEKHEARRQFEAMMEQNKKLLSMLEQPKQPVNTEPQREQFGEYEDFVTAKATWQAEQRAKQLVEEYRRESEEAANKRRQVESMAQLERQFTERRDQVAKENPDFQQVIEDWKPNIPKSVENLIVQMPEGPLLAYHLAKNPALESAFQGQPDYMHGVIIGQLLSTLKAPTKESSAPAPAPTVGTRTSSSDGEYTGPAEGYAAWARKHMK